MVPEEGRGHRQGEIWRQEGMEGMEVSETCNGEGEDYSLPDLQSFMMKKVPLAAVRTLNTRDGAGTSPRFLTS